MAKKEKTLEELLNEVDGMSENKKLDKLTNKTELIENNSKSSSVVKFKNDFIDTGDKEALFAAIMKSALDDKNKADSCYELFETRLNHQNDQSDSAKESLVNSVNSRIAATTNLVKLYETDRKYSENSSNPLVSVTIPSKKSGIDFGNIENSLDDSD